MADTYQWNVCVRTGDPQTQIFKTNDKKIFSYRIFIYNWGGIFILRTLKIRYMSVFCLFTLGRHGSFTAGVTRNSHIPQQRESYWIIRKSIPCSLDTPWIYTTMSVHNFTGQNIDFQTLQVNTNQVQLQYYLNCFPNIRFHV